MGEFTLQGCKDSVFSTNDFYTQFLFEATKNDIAQQYTVKVKGVASYCSNYWLFPQYFSANFKVDGVVHGSFDNIYHYPPERNTWLQSSGMYTCKGWDPSSGYLTAANYPAIANAVVTVNANSDGSCPPVYVNFNSYWATVKKLSTGAWNDAYSYLYDHNISGLIEQHAGKVDTALPNVTASVTVHGDTSATVTVSADHTCNWWAYNVYDVNGTLLRSVYIGNTAGYSASATIPKEYLSPGKYYIAGFATRRTNGKSGESSQIYVDTVTPTASNFDVTFNRLSSDNNSVHATIKFDVDYPCMVLLQNQTLNTQVFYESFNAGSNSKEVTLPSVRSQYELFVSRYQGYSNSITTIIDTEIPKLTELSYSPVQDSTSWENVGIRFRFKCNSSSAKLLLTDNGRILEQTFPGGGFSSFINPVFMNLYASSASRTLEVVRIATNQEYLNEHNASVLKTSYSVQCDTTLPWVDIDRYELQGSLALIEFHTDREVSKAEYALVVNDLTVNYTSNGVNKTGTSFTASSPFPAFGTDYRLYVRVTNPTNSFIGIATSGDNTLSMPTGLYISDGTSSYKYRAHICDGKGNWKTYRPMICLGGNKWFDIENNTVVYATTP